jgi:hypothetical protein
MRQLIRAEEKPLLIGVVVPLLPLRKPQMQEAIALDVQRPMSGLVLSRYMTTCRSQPYDNKTKVSPEKAWQRKERTHQPVCKVELCLEALNF